MPGQRQDRSQDQRHDPVLLLAAACVPIPEAMILMLSQPEAPAPDRPADDPPVTGPQRWLLNALIASGALALAAAVARLPSQG